MSHRGTCDRPSHGAPRQLCPIHGCAFCCVEWFPEIAEYLGVDVPPLGPPDVQTFDEMGPEWFTETGERWHAVDLWEGHVTDDGCRICREIVWQALPAIERAEIEAVDSGQAFCGTCFATQLTTRICTRCHRCPEHAEPADACEAVAERWSRVRRQRVAYYYENHDWCGGAA